MGVESGLRGEIISPLEMWGVGGTLTMEDGMKG